MRCPNCGSDNVISQVATNTETKENIKGFGPFKACCGWWIFGPLGILCGLCGMGKGKVKTTTTNKVINSCQDCGKQF